MKEITAEMFRSSSLKSVNFRGNNLDNDAAMSIAASLSGNRTLLDMDLRDNELHYDGADVIARLLTVRRNFDLAPDWV
jgi:Ran GTPase-activating protein (RanGAP) involved in mRNA processing and transport